MLLTNHEITVSIGVSQSANTWTYAELAEGIENVSEAVNEVVKEYYFLADNGFGRSHVNGMHPVWTVSGRRVMGDTAQDYIAGLKYKTDADRESSLKVEYTDNSGASPISHSITVPCTLQNIQSMGGGSPTDDSVFSVDISFTGAPTET